MILLRQNQIITMYKTEQGKIDQSRREKNLPHIVMNGAINFSGLVLQRVGGGIRFFGGFCLFVLWLGFFVCF